MLVKPQNSVFTLVLSLYNIKLTFIITHTLFQVYLNHQIDIKQNSQLKLFNTSGFWSLKMQRAMVNLCNHDESWVLSATNDTTPSLQNNSLGGLLPQKSIINVLKVLECR